MRLAGCGLGPNAGTNSSAPMPVPRVAEPLDGVETLRRPALGRQPGINQRVAKPVRQGIRQQPPQAMECPLDISGKTSTDRPAAA